MTTLDRSVAMFDGWRAEAKRARMQRLIEKGEEEFKKEALRLNNIIDDLREQAVNRDAEVQSQKQRAIDIGNERDGLFELNQRMIKERQELRDDMKAQNIAMRAAEEASKKALLDTKQMQEAMESNRQTLADAREAWADERATFLKAIKAAKV